MILSIARLFSEPPGAVSASELTDWQGHAIEDRQRWIIRQALTQPLSRVVLAATEVGGLAYERGVMEVAQARKGVAPMPLKIGNERAVLIQTSVLAHDLQSALHCRRASEQGHVAAGVDQPQAPLCPRQASKTT